MILVGDCRESLKTLPDQSVHCCVTSPPYFGLRDYGTAKWEGGDPECPHEPSDEWIARKSTANCALGGGTANLSAAAKGRFYKPDGSCPCGARRIDQQIGVEPTPDEFVTALVEVMREVRRVLRDDGTLWLNLGDTYATGTTAPRPEFSRTGTVGANRPEAQNSRARIGNPEGCKTKDLIGIPWMVAFALRADGWYLRQEIIWAKPNPMPESVRDRCTKSHEHIFLLSKSPKYYFDADGIKERAVTPAGTKGAKGSAARNAQVGVNSRPPEYAVYNGWRNKRDVWFVQTRPFKEAHFATFPPELIEPCIRAGCPVGGTVLDPFFGAGTTGLVALLNGRNYIGCELNPDYVQIADRRLTNVVRPIDPIMALIG